MNSAHVIFDMEAIEGSYRVCAGKTSIAEDVAYYTRNTDMEEKLLDEVWTTLSTKLAGFCRSDNWVHQKRHLVTGLSSHFATRLPEPPSYDQPPPSYDDVIHDLPPEYSALPPLAQRKSTTISLTPQTHQKSHKPSSSFLKDRMLDVRIDFENPTGVREHKKKKPAGGKKAAPPPSPSPPPPPPPAGGADGGDGNSNGDAGAGGDSGGAGGGDGGDGGDDWNAWNVSGKKDKKKKLEEEEEERKAKEEEERKAKEEEERQAKEEEERQAKEEEERKAVEASAAKDLSWAEDDGGGGGDDSWAAFTNVGKKKKGKVRPSFSNVQDGRLSKITGRNCTPWGVPGHKSG